MTWSDPATVVYDTKSMKEQISFCEAIVADLVRLFPDYPSTWFTSNAASSKPGHLLTITMPLDVAVKLIGAFVQSSS